jgi:putative ABC transport system ATP-binding protein
MDDHARTELRNAFIGFVFQRYSLLPVLSALENVALPLQLRGVSWREASAAARELLGEVEIERFANHRPDLLSGGQQQRVAIARALATDPMLVLADEPTANLDSRTAREVIALMKGINRERGTTFVFATHDQRLVEQVDREICLEDGLIMERGSRHVSSRSTHSAA